MARVYWSEGRSADENRANARLITAAPDLLAACELFKAYCAENCQSGEISWDELRANVEAAITKATGK